MTLAIELEKEEIIKRCDSNFEKLNEHKENEITKHNQETRKIYLNRIAGDGAAILNRDGKTIAIKAIFQPKVETTIEPVKKGTRHINSQKISQELGNRAIIFVVSTDGPITVFHKGEALFRVL